MSRLFLFWLTLAMVIGPRKATAALARELRAAQGYDA